jgi:hypothetical protein
MSLDSFQAQEVAYLHQTGHLLAPKYPGSGPDSMGPSGTNSTSAYGDGIFDGQQSGHEFYGTVWLPPPGWAGRGSGTARAPEETEPSMPATRRHYPVGF